jgi:hypothetical protein
MPKETDTTVIVDKALPATEMPRLESTIKGPTPYPMGGTTKEDMPIEDWPDPI